MSHAITNTNGFNEMAYVGEFPWHGLGQELSPGADIETWERQAGMAWKVQRSKVRYFADAEGSQQIANGTAWGLVNAATQYFDYDAGRTADSRIQSSWFGVNANRKQDIMAKALTLCD